MESEGKRPLIAIGTYGCHVVELPSGRFGFAGTVPAALRDVGGFNAELDGWKALAEWVKTLPVDQQRKLAADMSPEFFAECFG